jgi:hypothetical protein
MGVFRLTFWTSILILISLAAVGVPAAPVLQATDTPYPFATSTTAAYPGATTAAPTVSSTTSAYPGATTAPAATTPVPLPTRTSGAPTAAFLPTATTQPGPPAPGAPGPTSPAEPLAVPGEGTPEGDGEETGATATLEPMPPIPSLTILVTPSPALLALGPYNGSSGPAKDTRPAWLRSATGWGGLLLLAVLWLGLMLWVGVVIAINARHEPPNQDETQG